VTNSSRETLDQRAARQRKAREATDHLTATVAALRGCASPHEPADKSAARELMMRAWELLGDEGFVETCTHYAEATAKIVARKTQRQAVDHPSAPQQHAPMAMQEMTP
jgi:hypothetical protein